MFSNKRDSYTIHPASYINYAAAGKFTKLNATVVTSFR
jgi:hypothetical protein